MGKKLLNNFRDFRRKKENFGVEKLISTSLLKTYNTGDNAYIEEVYLSSKTTTKQFYNAFKKFVLDFRVYSCSVEFLQCIVDFWEKHGLNSSELEPMYCKWVDPTWFTLVKDIEYKPFWNWMFTQGIENLSLEDVLKYSDVSFEAIVKKNVESVYVADGFEFNHNKGLNKFLNIVWTSVVNYNMPTIKEAISVLSKNFAEEYILTSAYYYFIESEEVLVSFSECEALLYVIERMADYEYGVEDYAFSMGIPVPTLGENVGNVNVSRDVEVIIQKFANHYLLKDVVWLLENRFDVEREEIDSYLFEEFCDICMNYDLEEIMAIDKGQKTSILDVLFCFTQGEKVFNMFYDDIVTKSYRQELAKLESEYGILY